MRGGGGEGRASVAVLGETLLDGESIAELVLRGCARVSQAHACRTPEELLVSASRIAVVEIDALPERETPRLIRNLALRGPTIVVTRDATRQRSRTRGVLLAGAWAVSDAADGPGALFALVDAACHSHRTSHGGPSASWASPTAAIADGLTPREAQLVALMTEHPEASAALLGERLGVSANTVRAHLANIRKRVGVAAPNRFALLTALRDGGWLEE